MGGRIPFVRTIFFKERHAFPSAKNNLSSENKRNKKNIKISIFLFVENSFDGRIIVEINALRVLGKKLMTKFLMLEPLPCQRRGSCRE
jgi:hypothetical protein